MVLTIFTMIFAVCGLTACGKDKGSSGSVGTPTNIKYDASLNLITWDKAENATHYLVQVNGGAEINCAKESQAYNANKTTFTVSVKAVADGKKTVESEVVTKTFTYIPSVTDLSVAANGDVSWTPVAGGTYQYAVRDNGVVEPAYNASCTISGYSVGKHKYEVMPVVPNDDSYYSSWSNSITVTQLGKVDSSKVYYDGTYITFAAVPEMATKYKLTVVGATTVERTVSSLKCEYDAQDTNFSVTIQAIGDGDTSFDGEVSDVKQFKFLQPVENVEIVDGLLSWDEVPNADGYEIKINNGMPIAVTSNVYNQKLPTGQDVKIQVRATATDATFFSKFSLEKIVHILPAPVLKWNKNLELDGGRNYIYWDAVQSASGYKVNVTYTDAFGSTINKDVAPLGPNTYFYNDTFDGVGTYIISVSSLANEDGVYNSHNSTAITVVRPERAEKSVSGNFIKSYDTDLSKGFEVYLKDSSANYTYQLYKRDSNGTSPVGASQRSPQFSVASTVLQESGNIAGGEYAFEVQKLGRVEENGENIHVTLNSKFDDNLSFTITVLQTPQNPEMNGFSLEYESVTGATKGYAVNVGSRTDTITCAGLSCNLDKNFAAGTYYVSVCAKGNGQDVLPSGYTPEITVNRIAAPEDLTIETNVDNGKLNFTGNSYAYGGYTLYLNNEVALSGVETIIDMNRLISVDGTYVSLVANANQYENNNPETRNYYMTSLVGDATRFIKLATPTNLKFDNTHLTWTIDNINQDSIGAVSYVVFNDVDENSVGRVNARTIDLGYLEGGMTHTLKVQAIGDGVEYVNSDVSEPKSIYKLAAPEVDRVKATGKYRWSLVESASSYEIKVDGKQSNTQIETGDTYYRYFDPYNDFMNALGNYAVTFRAIGDGGLTTISSNVTTVTQEVGMLDKPEFTTGYTKEQYSTEGEVTVDITKKSPYAKGYTYVVKGFRKDVELDPEIETVPTYKYNTNGTGEFLVQVFAIGKVFDDNGVYLLNSQNGEGNSKVIILEKMNQDTIIINNTKTLTWTTGTIRDAVGYKVQIYASASATEFDGKNNASPATPTIEFTTTLTSVSLYKLFNQESINNVNITSINLGEFANVNNVKSLRIVITAMGNGSSVISSASQVKDFPNQTFNLG